MNIEKNEISKNIESSENMFTAKSCIITVASKKGGVGKTTTSINIYLETKADLLINLDPDGVYEYINFLREYNGYDKINYRNISTIEDLNNVITEYKNKKIVINCGGFDSGINRAAILCSSLVITPISDSIKDILSLDKVNKIMKEITDTSKSKRHIEAHVLINRVPSNKVNFPAFTDLSKTRTHLKLLKTIVSNKKSICERADSNGLSFVESEYQRIKSEEEQQSLEIQKIEDKKAEGKTVTLKKFIKPEINISALDAQKLVIELNSIIKEA